MSIRYIVFSIGKSMNILKIIIDSLDHLCNVLYSGYIGAKFSKCGNHFYIKKTWLF